MTMTAFAEVKCGKQTEAVSAQTSDGDHHWNNLNSATFHGITCVRACARMCMCACVYVCV